jgi:hypothetical protein
MIDFSKLIYMPVDIPNPPDVSKFFDTIDYKDMLVDTYRTCYHIPIMDSNGILSDFAKECDEFVNWLEDHVFAWSRPARMRIITTPPGEKNAPHIDCSPKKFGTLQHKFRYVFRGNISSLTFINNDQKVSIPSVDKCYLMDGSWPHEMINNTNDRKYTLTLGAPWEPQLDEEKYLQILKTSYNKYKEFYIGSDNWQLPENWKSLFEDVYQDQLCLLDNYKGR